MQLACIHACNMNGSAENLWYTAGDNTANNMFSRAKTYAEIHSRCSIYAKL